MRIELDATLAVEDHDGPVGGRVGGPVVARHPGAAEGAPPSLHLIADSQRGALIGRSGQQCAEPGAIQVEDGEQLGGVGPKPDQRNVRGA